MNRYRDAKGRFAKKPLRPRDAKGRFVSTAKERAPKSSGARSLPARDAKGRFVSVSAKTPAQIRAELAAEEKTPTRTQGEIEATLWRRWLDELAAGHGLDLEHIALLHDALTVYQLSTELVTITRYVANEQGDTPSAALTADDGQLYYETTRARAETLHAYFVALRHLIEDLDVTILSIRLYPRERGLKDLIGTKSRYGGQRPKKKKRKGRSRQLRKLPGETDEERTRRLNRIRKRDQRARDKAKGKKK